MKPRRLLATGYLVLVLVIVVAGWCGGIGKARADLGPASVKLADPWGQVGAEIAIMAVDVGGLQCAVMVQRLGSERRSQLWCAGR